MARTNDILLYEIAYHSADRTKTTNIFRKNPMFDNWFEKLAILSYIGIFYNRISPKDLTALVFARYRNQKLLLCNNMTTGDVSAAVTGSQWSSWHKDWYPMCILF